MIMNKKSFLLQVGLNISTDFPNFFLCDNPMSLPLMSLPVTLVLVGHIAESTLIWLGTCVDVEVVVQLDLLIKSLTTKGTSVLFHRVWKMGHSDVSPQISDVME